jgi:hypothetical protein
MMALVEISEAMDVDRLHGAAPHPNRLRVLRKEGGRRIETQPAADAGEADSRPEQEGGCLNRAAGRNDGLGADMNRNLPSFPVVCRLDALSRALLHEEDIRLRVEEELRARAMRIGKVGDEG